MDAPNILAMLKTVTNQPVRYVINTHHHGYHPAAMPGYRRPAPRSSPRRRRSAISSTRSSRGSRPSPLSTGVIDLGGKEVRLYHFGRAHTSGDVFGEPPISSRPGRW